MKLSIPKGNLIVLAILLASSFFAYTSLDNGKAQSSKNAPLGLSDPPVRLQADGTAPLPPPPPPKQTTISASLA
jgi:hypothetical protein